jgi:hypothetical protein
VIREFGEVDFYLTQLLTGHGRFGAYLHKVRIIDSPESQYGDSIGDDPQLAFFFREMWSAEPERSELEATFGSMSPDSHSCIVVQSQIA